MEGGKDYQDLYQKYIRLAADFENYKKRLAKEKADVVAYGNEELIKALLNVIDNLERALDHADAEEDPKPLIEGVKLVHKQFLSCLEKFGVQFVDASPGQEFDPRLHQAIERVESPDFTPGLIISEMLRGYTLKDRLLRPALVVVSKGAGGAGETDQNQGGAGSGDIFDLTDGD
jgi:molecular chaperone GrpE